MMWGEVKCRKVQMISNSAAAISFSKPQSCGNNMYENESESQILSTDKNFVP